MRRFLAAGFLLALSSIAAEEPRSPFLEWKPVQGAAAYVVQVRDPSGKVVFERTVDQNKVEVQLPPGKYQQRVSVLNKFRKPAGFSDWTEFNIRVAEMPDVEAVKPAPLPPDQEKKGERAVTIQGDHLSEGTKVYVETDKGKVASSKVEVVGENKLVASFDAAKIDQGKHDIIVENSRNKIVRVEDALRVDEQKKVTTASDPRIVREDSSGKKQEVRPGKDSGKDSGKDTGKDTGRDAGKDTGKDTGKEPGKDTKPAEIEPMEIYPAYKPGGRTCWSGGVCDPIANTYKWKFTLGTFVPGMTRWRSGDRKGYLWPGFIGLFAAGAVYEDRRADRVAKESVNGLGAIFHSPLVLGTYSYWTQPGFLLVAADQYKNLRNQRKEYRNAIAVRNGMLVGALLTYGLAVLDSAKFDDKNAFFFPEVGEGTGPIPMTRTLSNSNLTWKFSRDVWIPGKVRRDAGDFKGTITLGVIGGLAAGVVYEGYHQYRVARAADRLHDSAFNQLVSGPFAIGTYQYWTNPGLLYAVYDNNRQFKKLNHEYQMSRSYQLAYAGTAAFLYLFQVLDAATFSSDPGFFGPAKFEPGSNPLPMADMVCSGGPCSYSVGSTFQPRLAAFIPGRARMQNGDRKAGYAIAGSMVALGSLAVYEDYEANRARRAAVRAGREGVNSLFTSQIAVAAAYQYWTQPAYLVVFEQYYESVRKASRRYERAVRARTMFLGSAGIVYALQFLDGATLPRTSASSSQGHDPSEIAHSSVAPLSEQDRDLIRRDLRSEALGEIAQEKNRFHERFLYDIAEFHQTYSF